MVLIGTNVNGFVDGLGQARAPGGSHLVRWAEQAVQTNKVPIAGSEAEHRGI